MGLSAWDPSGWTVSAVHSHALAVLFMAVRTIRGLQSTVNRILNFGSSHMTIHEESEVSYGSWSKLFLEDHVECSLVALR